MAPAGIGTDPQASVPMLINEYFRIFPPVTFPYLVTGTIKKRGGWENTLI